MNDLPMIVPARLLLLALISGVAGCVERPSESPRTEPGTITIAPVVEPSLSAPPPAPTAAPASAPDTLEAAPCAERGLYVRYEASRRSTAFDAAARAFDRATADHGRKLYAAAARGFMTAAKSFLEAGDLDDRRWSYGNAVTSWEKTANLEEARAALLEAATRDAELADKLRSMAVELHPACAGR